MKKSTTLFSLLLIFYTLSFAQLNGTYTIGGVNPDYPTFTAANADLQNLGVSGPVIFNVRDGIYNEQVNLTTINGSSAINTVTFQSESGNNTAVTITYGSFNPSSNYTLRFDGADYVIIRNMTIEATGIFFGRVIEYWFDADGNTLENNLLRGISTTNTSTDAAVVYSTFDFVNENNQFLNNSIIDGSYGIYFDGNWNNGNRVAGTVIQGNTCTDQFYRAFHLINHNGLILNENSITSSNVNGNYVGAYLQSCAYIEVLKNQIYDLPEGDGIYLEQVEADFSNHNLIANNFVHVEGTNQSFGIYSSYGDYQDFIYNTVHLTNTHFSSRAFYVLGSSNTPKEALNNIFANTGGGYAIYANIFFTSFNSDYNDLYTTGSILGSINSTDQPTLADWQLASGKDANSISANPLLNTPNNYLATQVLLNNAGTPSTLVGDDIEGQIRDITTPDIGALEFTAGANDAGISMLIGPLAPFAAGSHAVEVQLFNNGTNTLTSVDVAWAINGAAQSTFNWVGTLASGATTTVNLGNFTFNTGTLHNLEAWTSTPNGGMDDVPVNDTLIYNNLNPALTGIYTIGGVSPDFNNFSDAATALNSGGVLDTVCFRVRNGIYNEQIELTEVTGVDSLNWVKFESESGDSSQVILTYHSGANNNYTMRLNGTDWITVQKMTIVATSSDYGRVLDISNGANHVSVLNNVLEGAVTTNFGNAVAVVYKPGAANVSEYLLLKNNRILNGSYGTFLTGHFNNGNYVAGIEVLNNELENQYYRGIYVSTLNAVVIDRNRVTTSNAYSTYIGIYLGFSELASQVTNNQVYGLLSGTGIYTAGADGDANNLVNISNNYIHIGGVDQATGIYTSFGEYQNFYYNSVNITNTNLSSRAFDHDGSTDITLLNNIFSNTGGGYAFWNDEPNPVLQSDYNDLYTSGSYLIHWNSDWSTLADWQVGGVGTETNSVSQNPFFYGDMDFHVAQSNLNTMAMAVPSVLEDLEGDIRHITTPDIGADEFNLPPVDAGITNLQTPNLVFAAGKHLIRGVLQNHGSNALTSATIQWQVNGSPQTAVNWTGNLAPGDTTTVDLDSVDFVMTQLFDLIAWSENPNGGADPQPINDTSKVENLFAALNGVFTIGGVMPSFNTFTEAIDALNLGGVSGAVTFNVRDGIYNEQLLLGEVQGASAMNTITFQSESGDSTTVTLSHGSSNFGDNYTWRLVGTDWLRIRNMTLEATDSFYGVVIDIRNEATNNIIENNVLQGISTTQAWIEMSVIYSPPSLNDANNTYRNNHFYLGSFAILLEGEDGALESGTVIENNILENQWDRSILLIRQDACVIKNNVISSNNHSTGYMGIQLWLCHNDSRIIENIVTKDGGFACIRLDDCNASFGARGLIANNFIQYGGTEFSDGLLLVNSNYQDIYHNNIHLNNTHSDSRGLTIWNGNNIRLYNNISYNSGGGPAIVSNDGINVTASDYNNWATTGGNLGWFGFNNGSYVNLAAWQAGTGMDINSISVDPGFTSSTDLHVSNLALDASGIPLSEVPYDIDGFIRHPNTPDIGADEFNASMLDAGLFAFDSPSTPLTVGNQSVQVTLANFGTDPLTSVTINWKVNGAPQTAFNWTGNLTAGATEMAVSLGSFNFQPNIAYDLEAWTSSPNGMMDQETSNDTLSTQNLYTGLIGVYTIGGVSPDFVNFQAAVTALENGGVLGPVTFNVRNGSYNEQISIPEIAGTNTTTPVIFQSETGDSTGVILTSAAATFTNNYVLRLNGADYIQFKRITIQTTNPLDGRVVEITGDANNNRFEGCEIIGIDVNMTYFDYVLVYSNGWLDDYNEFINNRFLEGSYGLYLLADGYFSMETGTRIEGNSFEGQYRRGIELHYNDAPYISHNKITSSTVDGSYNGINLLLCKNGIRVLNNHIYDISCNIGILLDGSDGANGDEALIANNFIQVGDGIQNCFYWGIYLNFADYVKVYHNNVHVRSFQIDSYAFYAWESHNATLRNNIFHASNRGRAIFSNNSNNFNSDYNDLFANVDGIGYWNGNNWFSLFNWQIFSGGDNNSLNLDPLFTSDTDLHINELALENAGTPVAEVMTDFDGESRDLMNPDIGADEFFTPQTDAGVCAFNGPTKPFAADVHTVYAAIKNFGIDTLQSTTIEWEINGMAQIPVNWTGSLATGEKQDSVNLGFFLFEAGTNYTLKAWTSNPNGIMDDNVDNDTTIVPNLYPALDGVYTIGGMSPDFVDFQSAVTALENGGILGTVTFNVRNGSYVEQLVIPEIVGTTTATPIIFQSESGDSTSVTLEYDNAAFDANYVVKLDGADCFQFKKITIHNTSTTYARVFEIANGANNNRWESNRIIGRNINSTIDRYALVYSGSSADDNNEFFNNHFLEGSYGLHLSGNFSHYEVGTLVENNTFEGQYYRALQLSNLEAPQIIANQVFSPSVYAFGYYSFYLLSCKEDLKILKNNIYDIPEGRGIHLINSSGTSGEQGLIANNFIHIDSNTDTDYGIYLTNSNYHQIYHNNIHLNTSATDSYDFYAANSSNLDIKNNVFYHSGSGATFYKDNASTNVNSNYNDLFTLGTNLGQWDGNNYTDLASWQSNTSQDANSKSIDPGYLAPNDLHVSEVELNKTGTPLAAVVEDIDGELRNPTAPDIGADEFAPTTMNDIGVVEIIAPSKTVPFPAGVRDVEVAIKNFGIDTITSAAIQWKLNGILQIPFNWTGNLFPGERDTATIGTNNFTAFFETDILAYTQGPNGVADSEPDNDTTEVQDLVPGLLGIYTIGGANPDFANFTEAAAALNLAGVLGAVTFDVRNGTYNEQVEIGEIVGTSAMNPVTFQSESGDTSDVILEYDAQSTGFSYIIRLDGADYVTIRDMTFRPLNSIFLGAINLDGGADYTSILNNHFVAPKGVSSFSVIGSTAFSAEHHTLVQNNHIEGGGDAIRFTGHGAQLEIGTIIQGNILEDQHYRGINLDAQSAPTISGNSISNTKSMLWSNYAHIYCNHCEGALSITKNQMSGGYGYGIRLNSCDASNLNRGLIANNFVQVAGTGMGVSYGLYLSNSWYQDVYHNSVNMLNDDVTSTALAVLYGGYDNIRNNIFANTAGGYAAFFSSNSNTYVFDYNDYYVTGSNLGTWNGTITTDLAAWQMESGEDANSLSVNPLFDSDINLHVSQVQLDGAGTPVAEVTDDIDGDGRDGNNPDIGADEFGALADDVGITAFVEPASGCGLTAAENVTVTIQNFGAVPQTGFEVAYTFENNAPVVENIGVLVVPPGGTVDYTFSTQEDLSSIGMYHLEAYTFLAGDQKPSNDTLENVVISHFAPMVVTTSLDTTICSADSINLLVTGGSTYNWSHGATGSSIFVAPTMNTTYTVTVTNINNCVEVDSILVMTLPLPTTPIITAGGATAFCLGDSVQLTSDVVTNIEWNTGATTASIQAKFTGDYTVTHTDPMTLCTSTSLPTMILAQEDSIQVAGFPEICNGDMITLTATNAATALWSTGETTTSITVAPNTTTDYWVDATTPEGCVYSDTVIISVLPNQPPDAVDASNMFPSDSSLNLIDPLDLSWLPTNNATFYNVHLWEKGTDRPMTPHENNWVNVSASTGFLDFGKTYYWQIESANSCFSTYSDTLEFSIIGLPDLVIDTVTVPKTALSGQSITLEWTVSNVGAGSTGSTSWKDYIWLSTDEDLRNGDDWLIAAVPNLTYLHDGESYTRTQTITLPQSLTGTYLLFVSTDNNDAYCTGAGWVCHPGGTRLSHFYGMAESNQFNNWIFDTITIFPAPAPDLKVQSVASPTAAFSGDTITVTFTVENEGDADANNNYWNDRLYISQSLSYNENTAMNLEVAGKNDNAVTHQNTLQVDSTYIEMVEVELPHQIFGDYYIHVFTDRDDHVFEGVAESNNTNSTTIPISISLTPPPDLQIDSVGVPPTAMSGENLTITWKGSNHGANAPPEYSWRDSLYISPVDTFDMVNTIRLSSGLQTQALIDLNPGVSYTNTVFMKLPEGINGNYYVYAKADDQEEVFEFAFEDNNVGRSTTPINVTLSPYPDFVVTNITANYDTLHADSTFLFSWTVENQGTGDGSFGGWADKVYISKDTLWNPNTATLLTSYFKNNVVAGDSYTRSVNLVVPDDISGLYYFYIFTDETNSQYEYLFENNNVASNRDFGATATLFIPSSNASLADLDVTSFTGPATGDSGQPVVVDWEVTNLGPDQTAKKNWLDYVYFSSDTLLDASDIFLGHEVHQGFLSKNAQYQDIKTVTLPNGLGGNYFLLLHTDAQEKVTNDTVRTNNVAYIPIAVTFIPPPDLVVESFNLPPVVYAGQQYYIPYTVRNNGPGAVIGNEDWRDRLYLSNTPDLSGNNTTIGSIQQQLFLEKDATYSDSLFVWIPSYLEGNFYVILKTDNKEDIYEHDKEGNNLSVQIATVLESTSLDNDLIITDLQLPDSLLLGESEMWSYTLKNEGTTAISTSFRDILYFSLDQSFSGAVDPVLEVNDKFLFLAPNDTVSYQLKSIPQNIEPGDYYGIMRTNVALSVNETNTNNNTLIADATSNLEVRELTVNVPDTSTLQVEDPIYYKVTVGADLDLLLTINSGQTGTGLNEVYVAFNRLPSIADFDFQHTTITYDQTLLIPETQAGTYFIYVKTQSSTTMDQQVEVLAQALPFSIVSVNPDEVGQGIVTTKVSGAGFRDSVEVRLEDGLGNVIAIGNVKNFISSMELDVQWDLTNVPIGFYDVVTENTDGGIAMLANGLEVEVAEEMEIGVLEIFPDLIRSGKSAFLTYEFENISNVDIPFGRIEISMPNWTVVSGVETEGDEIYLLSELIDATLGGSEDWVETGAHKIVPVLTKDLVPGENFTVHLVLQNFPYSTFLISAKVIEQTTEKFIQQQLLLAEMYRQNVLVNETATLNEFPSLVLYFNNPDAVRDSTLAFYFQRGLLSITDTIGVDLDCSDCMGYYDYDPGTSPGTEFYETTDFGKGEQYLWEINHPYGIAGLDPGWDIIKVTGVLNISATPSERFSIDISSLSSYNNTRSFLTTWSPGYDICWPIAIADGGIVGFDTTKFELKDSLFTAFNDLYGGQFHLELGGTDTLYLCFKAVQVGIGMPGVPGGPGQPGQPGGTGGPGGAGDVNTPPGPGGEGGCGGEGIPSVFNGGGPDILPGLGGEGGCGGEAGTSDRGGTGGIGGCGGRGSYGQSGAPGGDGGCGGFGGGDGGPGGMGGDSDPDMPPGPGGTGGEEGEEDPNNPPVFPPPEPGMPGEPGEQTEVEPPSPDNGPISNPLNPPPNPPNTPNTPEPFDPTEDGEKPIPCNGEYNGPTREQCEEKFKALGCATTIVSCAGDLVKYTLIGSAGGPAGLGVGATIAIIKCGIGTIACIDDGPIGDVAGHVSCAASALSLDAVGSLGCYGIACAALPVGGSCDPNEIVGPIGYGEDHWVSINDTLYYTIHFENDSMLATLPAQRVTIRQPIDDEVNPLSIRLGKYSFNNLTFDVPANTNAYTTTLDLESELGVDVEVTAGLDIINNEIFWVFQSIDPQTGVAPYDPNLGLLAVNDTLGSGQGFVNYTILPKASAMTGDTVTAQAEIIFDINDPIETNTASNIIDALPPTSVMDTLPNMLPAEPVTLTWSGMDDPGGVGVHYYDLYVSINGGPYLLYDAEIDTTAYEYILTESDTSYSFYVRATDHVGNKEQKNMGEISITFSDQLSYCDSLNISISSGTLVPLGVYRALGNLSSAGTIQSPNDVTFQAGNLVELLPGFQLDLGAELLAFVEDCILLVNKPSGKRSQVSHLKMPDSNAELALQIVPNALTKITDFYFNLPEDGIADLEILNVTGQMVHTLLLEESVEKGPYLIPFDMVNFEKGIYIARLKFGEVQVVKTFVITE